MGTPDVTATLEAVLDSKKYEAGADNIGKASKKAEAESKGFLETISNPKSLVTGIFGAAAAEAILKIGEIIVDLTKDAAEFLKYNEKFEEVFKGAGDAGEEMRKTLVNGYQLSTEDATKFLSAIQDTQEGLGLNAKEAAQFSGQAVILARQLEEFGKGSTQSNLDAMQAAFLGNYKGLRQLGVALDDSKVALLAQAQGFEVVNGKVSQNTKEQIIFQEITKANKNAVDSWGKSGLTASQTIDLMAAKFKDLKLAFGLSFQNELSKSTGGLGEFVQKFATLENLQIFADKVIKAVKFAANIVIGGFKAMVDAMFAFATPLIATGKLVYDIMTKGWGKAFSDLYDGVAKWAGDMGAIIQDAVDTVGKGGKAIWASLFGSKSDADKAKDDFKKSISTIGTDAAKALKAGDFGDAAKTIFDGVSSLLEKSKTDFAKVQKDIAADAKSTGDAIIQSDKEVLKEKEAYYKYIGDNVKAELLAAEESYNEQVKAAKGNADKLQQIDEAYTRQKVKIWTDAAKTIADTVGGIAEKTSKLVEGIFELAEQQEKQSYQDTLNALSDLDKQHSAVTKQRADEDYQSQAEQLQQEIADAKAANDAKTASDDQRQLDRLTQDKNYQDQKDQLDAEAKAKDSALKKKSWETAHAAAISAAIISTAQAAIASFASAAAIPYVGYIIGGVAAASALAFGGIQIANIASEPTPQFAQGGITPGGKVIVGEEGPELVELPAGSRVIPAAQTKNVLSGLNLLGQRGSGNSYSKTSSLSNDNRQYSFVAHDVKNPLQFINDAKRVLGDDVFQSARSRLQ